MSKEQAQQLIEVLSDLERESRDTVGDFGRAELLSNLANDFELCEVIMSRLPRGQYQRPLTREQFTTFVEQLNQATALWLDSSG